MSKSTARSVHGKAAVPKPDKPSPDFPLVAHPAGYWCKKIRGELHYFGPWRQRLADGRYVAVDPNGAAALKEYKRQADDLHAGRKPRSEGDGTTVAQLCDRFVVAKRDKRDNGELSPRTWTTYKAACDRLVAVFGKKRLVSDLAADDFAELRKDITKTKKSAVALGVEIQRTKTVFKYAYDQGLIEKPVRYGQSFDKPRKHVLRKQRAKAGEKMLEAEDCRTLINAASPQLKAMLLLALNAGLGNTDCAGLEVRHLDLEGGWLTYPREKTGVARRAKLWPETVKALRHVLEHRKQPKSEEDAALVFLTKMGKPWVKFSRRMKDGKQKITPDDAIAKEVRKLLDETKLYRRGLGLYALRHVFRTIADETRDFPAVRLVMGHADSSIDDAYRERIGDDRLEAVADHVRAWLFPKSKRGGRPTADGRPQLRVVG